MEIVPGLSHLIEQSQDLYLRLGEAGRSGLARTRIHSGILEADKGNNREANRILKESLVFFQEEKDQFWESDCLLNFGLIAWSNLEFEAAWKYIQEDLRIKQAIGDQDGIGSALWCLGRLAFDQGEDEQARDLCEQSRQIFSAIKNIYQKNLAVLCPECVRCAARRLCPGGGAFL